MSPKKSFVLFPRTTPRRTKAGVAMKVARLVTHSAHLFPGVPAPVVVPKRAYRRKDKS